MNKEKDNYLTKSEMLEFLKKKKILVDSDTKNFPRFSRKHGIIYKKVLKEALKRTHKLQKL